MGRNRSKCTNSFWCNCPKHRRNRELLGDTVMTVTAVTGAITDPAPQPNTDMLEDSRQSHIERSRASINEATTDRRSPNTSQSE